MITSDGSESIIVEDLIDTRYLLEDLTPGTQYEVSVVAKAQQKDRISSPSPAQTATTGSFF